MSDELSLFNFHETGTKEKTRRLITNIIPLSNIFPQLIEDANSQKTRELAFLQDGIRSVADTPEKLANWFRACPHSLIGIVHFIDLWKTNN